jgi:hypothetical protein
MVLNTRSHAFLLTLHDRHGLQQNAVLDCLRLQVIADSSSWSSVWLGLRSLLWTILLPGFFAGYVPWRFFGVGRVPFQD